MRSILLVLLVFPMISTPAKALGPGEDFDARIAPILARRCLDCHSGPEPKGKLDLSRKASALNGGESGPAIVPGRPEDSGALERIKDGEMPPKEPMSEAEVAALRDWIAAGATWGTDPIDPYRATTVRRAGRDWWAFHPVVRPEPPRDGRERWARTPIDAFVLAKLRSEGLSPAPEGERRSLIRRLAFDLTGLPPTPEEVEAFLADESADAYERLVDRYLASPQYGVRWARWWLDLARFGESDGFEYDGFRLNAWRYRDWVVDALNRDMPYDEFARMQLAGDVLRPDDPGAVEATGFLVAGAYDVVGQTQQSQAMRAVARADEMEDLVGTVGQTFLGLTVNCARCHDHKFDPIRQAEYYRIASALDGVRRGERDLSTIDPEGIAIRRKIDALSARIATLEAPAREKVVAARRQASTRSPVPIAAWDFDRTDPSNVELHGGAAMTPEGLRLDGKTGFGSAPLLRGLKAKTIEAWVRLDGLDQRGGGAISVQKLDGQTFDAIVFGELQPRRWMPGSENFVRSSDGRGEPEVEAGDRPVHVAITYSDDGMIRVFRDGRPYRESYRSSGPIAFEAGKAEVVFGLRHSPAGANRVLAGTVVRARLYDRALDPSELAASARSFIDHATPTEIDAELDNDRREVRRKLVAELEASRAALASKARKSFSVIPREPGATRVHIRGNPSQPGEVVSPGGVAAVTSPSADFGLAPDAPEAERRRRLAGWVTDRQNPLFARVIVNRLWQSHFGSGLVENTSDLGFNGGTPSHPELLDWLASELVASGWSLKSMHRLMVTSAAYRQSSLVNARGMARDAGDRLLWRKAPVRLEAEMVRDAMLSVSGKLDGRLGGPSYRDHRIDNVPGTPAILYFPVDPASPGPERRTLYRAWARGGRNALLDAFDCPDPSTTAPRRPVTTTPIQALALMNNALTLHLADAFAARIAREAGRDPARQAELAFRLGFGRAPEPGEWARASGVVERFGAATLARAIFNSNEFLYLD